MKNILLYLLAALTFAIIFSACAEDKDELVVDTVSDSDRAINSCEGCHTNYDVLKDVYTPDDPSSGGGHGCGGDAPHYEPYDRVYLSEGSSDYQEFKADIHGRLECTYCHNGVNGTSDKETAHSNDFIQKPSTHADEKCGVCHADIYERAHNNLHANGWGQKSMLTLRYGLGTGPDKFDQLPDDLKHAYDSNCATCHGTCGDCHINRPPAGGGGLYKSHKFNRKPDMRDNCTACHSSRGGHAYFGIAAGTKPDVHYSKAGFECTECHSGQELHGDGEYHDQRYKLSLKPECVDCHTNIAGSNEFHSTHINNLNCNTCHSQDYNNCGSCHIGAEGARIESHLKFKIAMNPLPDIKPYSMVTVRQSLMAPDSWDVYGIDDMPNFSVRPTYKYSTPHNIQRWTTRTADENGAPYTTCYYGCHIRVEADTVYNKEFYLFESDLQDWEIEANKGIVVDGKLPSSWGL